MSVSLSRLQAFYSDFSPRLLVHAMITREFTGSIAGLTSFGRYSGLLLAFIAEVDPDLPIYFLKHGSQQEARLAYGERLAAYLGLRGVRLLTAPASAPLGETLETRGILALLTGRKAPSEQAAGPLMGLDDDGVFRIHPLSRMRVFEQCRALEARGLPPHPLGAPEPPPAPQGTPEPAKTAPDWNL